MIEIARSTFQIIIYTDYSITINIVKQIKLIFNNINKFNLRLMRASIYLSQFNINVRHKSNKQHIIFNVLFKLSSDANAKKRTNDFQNDEDTFDVIYHVILMKMFHEFKSKLKQAYSKNKR